MTNSPLSSIPPVSSREIHFLKPESGTTSQVYAKPDVFVSDLIFSETAWMEAFTSKLNKAVIPDNRFHCAVIRQTPRENTPENQPGTDPVEALFLKIIEENGGIWGRISTEVFVLALWELDTDTAETRLRAIQTRLESRLNRAVTMGVAWFPFKESSRQDTFHNAVKALDHAAFFGPGSFVLFDDISLNISGDRLYETGRIAEAAREYQAGLDINPENLNLINSLGVCFGLMKDLDRAMQEFEKAIRIDATEVMAVYNAGLASMIRGDNDKGLEYLLMASGITNDIYEVELTIGDLLCRTDRLDEARPHLDQAARLKPDSSAPRRIVGDYFLNRKDPETAIPEYNAAIRMNPADASALSSLARAFAMQDKNLDIALTFARESLAIAPDSPEFNRVLGEVYLKMNRNDLAEAQFARAETLENLK